jgi:hypothetical protein
MIMSDVVINNTVYMYIYYDQSRQCVGGDEVKVNDWVVYFEIMFLW